MTFQDLRFDHLPLWLLSVVVGLLALCEPLAAEDLRFDHLTVADGLAHASVWRIHQDSRGFLWIATESYLQRYDGYELVVYKNEPEDPESISDSKVMAILEDRQGNMWFGTRSRGLNRYDRVEERFVRYLSDPEDPGSLTPGIVFRLVEGRDGEIWAAMLGGGVNRLRDEGAEGERVVVERFLHDPEDPGSLAHNSAQSLLEDRSGALWVGTSDGLDRLDRDRGTFVHHRPDPTDPTSLSHRTVSALFEDSRGALWAGTWDGMLHRLVADPPGGFVRYGLHATDPGRGSGFGIWVIHEDDAGDLWLGTNGGGVAHFDRATETFRHYRHDANDPLSLSSDAVLDIHRDQTGMLWLATRVNVSKLDPRWGRFEVLRHRPGRDDGLVGSEVIALAEDRAGWLWVGTRDTGLSAIERGPAEATEGGSGNGPKAVVHYRHDPARPESLPHGTVRALLEDRHGELWVGTSGGFGRLVQVPGRPVSESRRFVSEPAMAGVIVTCLLEDSAGGLWLGSESGLYQRADGEYVKHTHDPAAAGAGADRIYTLHQDRSDRLWLGTGGGLGRFEPGRADFHHWSHDPEDPSSPGAEVVMAIVDGAAGGLWIGTYGGGLDHWRPATSEPASGGAASGEVAKGDVAKGTWRHFREKDGLANDHVVGILVGPGGDLWIASNGGLSRFDPRSETFRSYDAGDGLHGNIFYFGSRLRTGRGELMFGGQGGLTAFYPEHLGGDDPVPPAVALTAFRLAGERVSSRRRDAASPLARAIDETRELVLSHRQRTFSFEFAALDFRNPEKNRYAYRLEGYDDDWIETDADRRLARFTNLDPKAYVFRVKAANKDGVWSEQGAALRLTVLAPPWRTWWAYALYGLMLAAVIAGVARWQRRKLARERRIAERERAASRRLRAVDKLKDEFMANTSHELRTPLYGITGLAESLIDGATGELPEATKVNLAMIVASGRRLSHLVGDILDFSKLRHKSLEINVRPVDLRSLVEVVLTLSRPLVGSKDLKLHNAVPADLPAAAADENRLQQILHNLVGNAVKFTESGEVKISAESREDQLVVRVSDSGIGIPEDKQEKIFAAFEQADASIERSYGGTGLGLAVTRQLVELHGGRIWVESAPDEGSTFFFRLPISRQETAEVTETAVASPAVVAAVATSESETGVSAAATSPASSPAGARILVVDDEPVNRQVLANYLSTLGYELVLAPSGEEALRLLEEQRFDLMLLDVMMPRVSGYEVCRVLRESYPIEELPVIFLTAKNQPSDVATGLSLGANDYLAKPISKGELSARMRPHLDLLYVHRNLEELVTEKMSEVKMLRGLLPMCASCKKVREDDGYWSELEVFIDVHSEAQVTHGLCPECAGEYRRSRGLA